MTTNSAASEQARLFDLLTRQSDWIHRRVDRTDLESDGETSRRISFDLTIEEDLRIDVSGGVVVPLTLMTKTPLRRLHTFGPDGHSMPVLARGDNGALVAAMLLDAINGLSPDPVTPGIEAAVWAGVMENNPTEMQDRLDELEGAVETLSDLDPNQVAAVLALAADLVQQFLFVVLLPKEYVGTRVVIKVSVIEEVAGRFPDWAFSREGRSMDVPLSLLDSASSAHFEFRAPLGLRVSSVQLLDELDAEAPPPGPAIAAGRTVHFTGLENLAPTSGTSIRARIELEPVADGFVRQTAVATGFVAVLLLLGSLQVEYLRTALEANRGGSVAAAALAVPALFLSVQARAPEHAWVARALFVPRLLNIATAILLYAAAVYLVTVKADAPSLEPVMWVFFAAQGGLSLTAGALLWVVSAQPTTVADAT
jgi:hypothetical protein